mmetsp:Transcript_39819/g.66800  ORF Transcript_39819/g.66800 Transcript_39819/m.66800 type:complete len:263 (-) Transcript_39819:418-1206(-)
MSVLRMSSGGMQLISRSYSFCRTWKRHLGLCSLRISCAISCTYSSQSIVCTACVGVNGYWFTLHASMHSNALRMLRSDPVAIRAASSLGRVSPSFLATCSSTSQIWLSSGAGTLTHRHRLRTASVTLEILLQTSIRRHALAYFSIVRRSPYCASRVSLSTSFKTITLNPLLEVFAVSSCRYFAVSFITSWTMYLSFKPASLGLSSMWYMLDSVVSSTSTPLDIDGLSIFHSFVSGLSFSAPGPNISRRRARMSVFLPAPEGP